MVPSMARLHFRSSNAVNSTEFGGCSTISNQDSQGDGGWNATCKSGRWWSGRFATTIEVATLRRKWGRMLTLDILSGKRDAIAFAEDADRNLLTTAWVLTEVADGCAARGNGAAFVELMDALGDSPEVEVVPPDGRMV